MMNAATGRRMPLQEHIAQSVENILFTRLGTRVQREEYGSLLPELIDMPLTPAVIMLCQAAAVAALARWEPRISVRHIRIQATDARQGRLNIRLHTVLKDGSSQTVEINT